METEKNQIKKKNREVSLFNKLVIIAIILGFIFGASAGLFGVIGVAFGIFMVGVLFMFIFLMIKKLIIYCSRKIKRKT